MARFAARINRIVGLCSESAVFNGHQKSMKNRLLPILLHHFAGFGPSSWLCKTSRIGVSPDPGGAAAKRSLWVRVAAGLSIGLCPALVYAAPPATTTTLGITAAGATGTPVPSRTA